MHKCRQVYQKKCWYVSRRLWQTMEECQRLPQTRTSLFFRKRGELQSSEAEEKQSTTKAPQGTVEKRKVDGAETNL